MSVSPYKESIQKKTMPDVPQRNTQKCYKDEITIIKKNPQRPNYRINFLNLPINLGEKICAFSILVLYDSFHHQSFPGPWSLFSASTPVLSSQCDFPCPGDRKTNFPRTDPPNPDFSCSLPGNKGLTGTSWVETCIILERVPVKTLVHALCAAAPYWSCTNMHTDNDSISNWRWWSFGILRWIFHFAIWFLV